MALEETATGREAPAKLVMRGIAKAFHGVRALEDVSFECRSGEVQAIRHLCALFDPVKMKSP